MRKNPLIPDTWGLPADQAKKVGEALNKKSLSPEDAVQKALDEIARDIAIIEPEPSDWVWWLTYLLGQLEIHMEKRRLYDQYEHILKDFVEKIQNRIRSGKW